MTPADATNCPCCKKASAATAYAPNPDFQSLALKEHHANMDALNERVRELEGPARRMLRAIDVDDADGSRQEWCYDGEDVLRAYLQMPYKSSPTGTGIDPSDPSKDDGGGRVEAHGLVADTMRTNKAPSAATPTAGEDYCPACAIWAHDHGVCRNADGSLDCDRQHPCVWREKSGEDDGSK